MITIEEDDSFIQPNGIAKMITVAVKKADGKIVRFPYSAKLSLASLIKVVNTKIGDIPPSQERVIVNESQQSARTIIKELAGESEGKIKKEDLVRCVKLLPRDKDAPVDVVVGGIYRVLALPNNKQPYYEVIDDTDYHKADIPRRVPLFPEEIEFFSKRKPPIPKELGKFEQLTPCELCAKYIVGHKMEDERYHAFCQECSHETVIGNVVQPA